MIQTENLEKQTNSMLINLPTLGNRDFIVIFSLLISSFQCCNREQATQSQYFWVCCDVLYSQFW